LSYWKAAFGIQRRNAPPVLGTKFPSWKPKMIISFMNAGPLSNGCILWKRFWQQLKEHSSYDDFGKKGILQHLKDIKPAVMTVGGWFDARFIRSFKYLPNNRKPVKIIILLLWGHGVMEMGKKWS
jgi:hypothetical protein